MNREVALRDRGLKVTLPRVKVLEVLKGSSKRHLSAEDIHSEIAAKGEKISLATVYRVLSHFEQSNIVSRNQFEAGISVYEFNDGNDHDHLVCVDCGCVKEFSDESLLKQQESIAAKFGFQLKQHCVVLLGLCADCCEG
ncbi:MAG TPA: ferric iron uptake transcriptional regulator [Gammaproteobacteria bacterium]|nr:ferric iron uptake transcriptional regulator [Gammaproteobacteria bacterium]